MGLVQSRVPVYNRTFVNSILAAYFAVPAAPLVGATLGIHLFKNDLTPNPDTPYASFEECDFSGYAPVVAAMTGTCNIGENQQGRFVNALFGCDTADPFEQGNAVGYYITKAATPTDWIMAERFDSPQPITLPNDYIDCLLAFLQLCEIESEA